MRFAYVYSEANSSMVGGTLEATNFVHAKRLVETRFGEQYWRGPHDWRLIMLIPEGSTPVDFSVEQARLDSKSAKWESVN